MKRRVNARISGKQAHRPLAENGPDFHRRDSGGLFSRLCCGNTHGGATAARTEYDRIRQRQSGYQGVRASVEVFAPIWGRNAFKAARPQPKKPKPVNKSLDKLAVATIPARLLGTMYSDVPVFSRAVILTNNKQKLVKIGDTLSGFKVEEIRRRAIVLVKGRQRQLLLIDKHDKKIASKKGESRKMISRSEIKKKLQNLDALAKDISVAPATRGKQKGLWVRQLRQGSLFSKAGLEKDDVVLKIGGEPVVGGVNPLGFFKMLDRDQVVVDVLRRGKPMQLVLILSR